MVADLVLQKCPALDARGFCIGSLAPDCNVENENWTAFTPPREVTHWMRSKKKTLQDCEDFYLQRLQNRTFSCPEEHAFFWGYYAHLVLDALTQHFLREEKRLTACFARIKERPALQSQIEDKPQTFDMLKQVFGKNIVIHDIAALEQRYVLEHPNCCYNTILRQTENFPDYLDILPPGAIVRKICVMAPAIEQLPMPTEQVFFSEEEFFGLLQSAADHLLSRLQIC